MIVLIGFMGAGKSTVGPILAKRLDLPFVDTDDAIAERAGVSIVEIFATAGEEAFRALEHESVAAVLGGERAVVGLGGGALGDPTTRAALSGSTVVYLETSLEECLRRIGAQAEAGNDAPERPMLGSHDPGDLLAQRASIYAEVADHVVATDDLDPVGVTERIFDLVGAAEPRETAGGEPAPSSPKARAERSQEVPEARIEVELGEHSYAVVVGSGCAGRLDEHLTPIGDAEMSVIVTESDLLDHAEPVADALRRMDLRVEIETVAPGEGSKSMEVAGRLLGALAGAGMHRHDLVVGVGGGVVTDLGAFVASTFNRGVAVAHVPTTLLGQVDAAIGGKTGVNIPQGKNLVGTFWQPRVVVCDVATLATLPEAELRSGLAEVVKYGFIARPELLGRVEREASLIFERDPATLSDIVRRSAEVKVRIVSADEREQGERAVLNYGHTFGHAIEHAAGYEGVRHGEAVSLGMMAAAYLARELGRIDEDAVELHRRTLSSVGLPTSASFDIGVLERAWRHDKKYRGGVRFVLLSDIGKPESGVAAPRDAIVSALEALAK